MDEAFSGLMDDYLLDARERLARVEELLLEIPRADRSRLKTILEETRRELHTLKGNSGMMGMKQLQALAHRAEDCVDHLEAEEAPDVRPLLEIVDSVRRILESARNDGDPETERPPAESPAAARPGVPDNDGAGSSSSSTTTTTTGSMRVPFSALDELVELLAEMVIFRNRLSDAVANGRSGRDAAKGWEDVSAAEESLGKTLGFIQDRVMKMRMMPLQSLFRHLHRIVFEEGRKEKKQVRLITSGGETPMDKALLETASEALGHLIRNAVIHGIEPPDVRSAMGKPVEGTVRLTACTRGNEVAIEVEDDGQGIDRQGIAKTAADRGMDPAAGDGAYSLLFLPGFSTKADADLSAGRGMGLSAAMKAVQKIGGRIEVCSEAGAGSLFRLHMPLSVSITRALIIRADGEEYALPLSAIMESLHFSKAGDGHEINHAGTYRWREGVIPLLDLGQVFGTHRGIRKRGFVVIFQADGRHRGLIGDELPGIKEIVVKALDPMVGYPPGLAGSTILGDGRVVLILDARGLMAIKPFLENQTETTAAAIPDCASE